MSDSYSLNGEEHDAPGFLRALAEDLYKTPGGWGGVCEDLRSLANKMIPNIKNLPVVNVLDGIVDENPCKDDVNPSMVMEREPKPEWEMIIAYSREAYWEHLEKLKIPGGHLYKTTICNSGRITTAMVIDND